MVKVGILFFSSLREERVSLWKFNKIMLWGAVLLGTNGKVVLASDGVALIVNFISAHIVYSG